MTFRPFSFWSLINPVRLCYIWVCFFAAIYPQASLASTDELQVTASLSANPVLEYETFTLTVSANQRLPNTAFRPEQFLSDFRIRGTSVSSSSRIIQNEAQHTTEWRVSLIAPPAGSYRIPPLTINGVHTLPIPFQVVPRETTDTSSDDYFILTELESADPYVQQQVRLTIQLFMANPIESGSIELPELEHIQVEQLGQDRQSQDIVNGRRYQVLTRTYLLTPRRSGEFILEPIRFEGQARIVPSGSISTFGRLERVSAIGETIAVNVRPRPTDFEGSWLPSAFVLLEEQWNPEVRLWTIGEPITRMVTLTAAGVRPEQLPDLTIQYPDTLRVYPDRGQTDTRLLRGQPVSRVTYMTAIIPAQAGDIELPELRIPWWNIETDRREYAVLPAQTIRVIAPPGGVLPPGSIEIPASEPHATALDSEINAAEDAAINNTLLRQWRALALVALLLWLITLSGLVWLLLGRYKQTNAGLQNAKPQTPVSVRKPLQQLKTACQKNDAQTCAEALRAWHQLRTGRPAISLPQIADGLNSPGLSACLADLEVHLFTPHQTSWTHGKTLWEHMMLLHQNQHKSQGDIPPLYPQESHAG